MDEETLAIFATRQVLFSRPLFIFVDYDDLNINLPKDKLMNWLDEGTDVMYENTEPVHLS